MATNTYQDVDGDWTNAANWSEGSTPAATEAIRLMKAARTRELATNLPGAGAGIDYDSLYTGPAFYGKLGSSGGSLYLGSTDVQINSPHAAELWLAASAGEPVNLWIKNANAGANALVLTAGTFADVLLERAGMLRLATGVTITALRMLFATARQGQVRVDPGATLTALELIAGTIHYNTANALPTLIQSGGTFEHGGSGNVGSTKLTLTGGRFNFHGTGGTIADARVYGGVVDCNGGDGSERAITDLYPYGGRIDLRGLGNSVTIGTIHDGPGEILY